MPKNRTQGLGITQCVECKKAFDPVLLECLVHGKKPCYTGTGYGITYCRRCDTAMEPKGMCSCKIVPSYITTTSNIYLCQNDKARLPEQECDCADVCDESCDNRIDKVECSRTTCNVGLACTNRSLQQRTFARVKLVREGAKGWGVRLQQRVSKGQLVLEYVGEVIDLNELNRRRATNDAYDKYVMKFKQKLFVDARTYGNESRFVNHSCDPNCVAIVMQVDNEFRIGFYALKTFFRAYSSVSTMGGRRTKSVAVDHRNVPDV
jgi:hypothetical protein